MHLRSLRTVRSMCDGPAPLVMFQTLQFLDIYRCGFRGCLFTSDIAHCLLHLEEIWLNECPFLQRLVEESNKKIIFPKLRILTLEYLPELCYDSATIDIECPSLAELKVINCPKFFVSISEFHTVPAFQGEEH